MKPSALFDTPVALWRLNRDGHTIVAEVHEIEGIGLELRYMRAIARRRSSGRGFGTGSNCSGKRLWNGSSWRREAGQHQPVW
jgi:hypothetical protein